MSMTREPIDVRVSDGTLRFGDVRLPLRTVLLATTADRRPDRRVIVRTYALTVARWLIPAAIVAAVVPVAVELLINVCALVCFTVSTARLAGHLRVRLHELVVATTTGMYRVLTGTDATAVAGLAFRIMDAVRDPVVEFHVTTENVRLVDDGPGSPQENPANLP
ncbi:hypothetical protein [Actinophytocola sp. NPDC049390]|uniref:hypothetical protein n=1 Tax=Actinophytocola sp. NPDC049390 TaxID=3363894 RepID=UPI0037A0ADCA